MLAQYIVSLGATTLQKSKKSVKAVNFPQVNKETTFHVYLLVESPKVHLLSKNRFHENASSSALFLIRS